MKIKDLLEVRGRGSRSGSGSEDGTIELSSDDESIEVDLTYHFNVDEAEYEGSYVAYRGGVDLEDTKVHPFTFMGKKYTKFAPELLQYIDWPRKFEAKHKALIDRATDEEQKHPLTAKECDDLMEEYFVFDFENYVANKIDIPAKHYPMTR